MVTPPSTVVDEGIAGHNFVLHIHDPIHRQIALPLSFAAVVSELNLAGLWLRAQGYPYCPLWVSIRTEGPASVFLEDSWKVFARLFNAKEITFAAGSIEKILYR